MLNKQNNRERKKNNKLEAKYSNINDMYVMTSENRSKHVQQQMKISQFGESVHYAMGKCVPNTRIVQRSTYFRSFFFCNRVVVVVRILFLSTFSACHLYIYFIFIYIYA